MKGWEALGELGRKENTVEGNNKIEKIRKLQGTGRLSQAGWEDGQNDLGRQELIKIALSGLSRSYAPYSRFHVSAALLCKNGKVYTGNNIENAAYSPGICAERCAFAKAVSEGEREFESIVICGGPEERALAECPPCGVCRQVMREFCLPDTFSVILAKENGEYREFTLAQLLPERFGPELL